MGFIRFEPDIWIKRMAEELLAPPVFSGLPKPTEEEIERVYQLLKQVAWENINIDDEESKQTYGRLIDADVLKAKLGDTNMDILTNEVKELIDSIPTATADRPHGEWYQIKDHKVMGEGYLWHCSICDYKVYQDSSADYPSENFCPNCGARMKGGDTECV